MMKDYIKKGNERMIKMKNERLKRETIKKLEDLRGELPNMDYENIYCDLWNILADYDNEAQDNLYLCDALNEIVEFVDDEIMEYLIEACGNDIDRLRCFIGDTHSSSLYKVDRYGNLENVNDDDFIYCIDEIIERIKESEEN